MPANIAKIAKVTTEGFFLLTKNTRDEYRKNNKYNKNQDLESKEAKKDPKISAKVIRIFMLAENTHDKYHKTRKNNKSNKNQD